MTTYAVLMSTHPESSSYEGWISIEAESAVDAIRNVRNFSNTGQHFDRWSQSYPLYAISLELAQQGVGWDGKRPEIVPVEQAFGIPENRFFTPIG